MDSDNSEGGCSKQWGFLNTPTLHLLCGPAADKHSFLSHNLTPKDKVSQVFFFPAARDFLSIDVTQSSFAYWWNVEYAEFISSWPKYWWKDWLTDIMSQK